MTPAPAPGRAALLSLAALPLLLALGVREAAVLLAIGLGLQSVWRRVRRGVRSQSAGAPPPGLGAVTLGRDRAGHPVALEEAQLAAHGLILGASGAGKTTTLLTILGDRIAQGRPVVAIDMKGSPAFAEALAAAAGAAGRRLRVWSPDGPEQWNPLRHGHATELKDKLIATERFSEPHYQRAAERYLQLALQVLLEQGGGSPPMLGAVVAALEPRRLAVLARELPAERRRQVAEYLTALTADQHSAIRGLATRLAIISESHTGAFLQGEGLDLRRALAGEDVVLFSLNSSVYGKLAAQLGTLALQDLVAASGHRLIQAGPRVPALVGIDEFSALGSDNVISLLARGRESGVSVLLATQELADLDRAARGLRDQVLGVTAVKIVHRQDVPVSAHTVAQMAGSRRVWEHTYSRGRVAWGRTPPSRVSSRQVEQFLVHPDQIKSLRTGEAIVLTKVPEARVQLVSVAPPRPTETVAPAGAPAPAALPGAAGPPPVPVPSSRARRRLPLPAAKRGERDEERRHGRALD